MEEKMDNTYKRTSRIENFLSMLLTKAKISDNLFLGNLPAALESSWNDMVFVKVLNVQDYGAYAKCTVNVSLYAKATDSLSRKPVKKLNKMEVSLDKAIEECFNENYSIEVGWRYNDYDSSSNYYYDVVNLNVTIRKMYN